MEAPVHGMTQLFEQLGLPAEPAEIQRFIARHRPLPTEVGLAAAPFWNPTQAAFLAEQVDHDADWAGIIDRLDAALRAPLGATEAGT
jgi:hypothetical protein